MTRRVPRQAALRHRGVARDRSRAGQTVELLMVRQASTGSLGATLRGYADLGDRLSAAVTGSLISAEYCTWLGERSAWRATATEVDGLVAVVPAHKDRPAAPAAAGPDAVGLGPSRAVDHDLPGDLDDAGPPHTLCGAPVHRAAGARRCRGAHARNHPTAARVIMCSTRIIRLSLQRRPRSAKLGTQ